MSAQRPIAGSDLARAISDLTGLSRKAVRRLAREACKAIRGGGPHEFQKFRTFNALGKVETALCEAFGRASPRPLRVAALVGPPEMLHLLEDDQLDIKTRKWSSNERVYFAALSASLADWRRTGTCANPMGRIRPPEWLLGDSFGIIATSLRIFSESNP